MTEKMRRHYASKVQVTLVIGGLGIPGFVYLQIMIQGKTVNNNGKTQFLT